MVEVIQDPDSKMWPKMSKAEKARLKRDAIHDLVVRHFLGVFSNWKTWLNWNQDRLVEHLTDLIDSHVETFDMMDCAGLVAAWLTHRVLHEIMLEYHKCKLIPTESVLFDARKVLNDNIPRSQFVHELCDKSISLAMTRYVNGKAYDLSKAENIVNITRTQDKLISATVYQLPNGSYFVEGTYFMDTNNRAPNDDMPAPEDTNAVCLDHKSVRDFISEYLGPEYVPTLDVALETHKRNKNKK